MTGDRLQIRTERHGQAPGHDRRPASVRPPAFRPGDADLRKADNAWFGAAHAGPDEIGGTKSERRLWAPNRCEGWPRSVPGPGTRAGTTVRLSLLVSSRYGAFPPVDGFCVGGHAVE